MKDYGLVSIITPSYNCCDFIGATIESIQSQTYRNWELIITDDCSTDNSRELIESYAKNDSRIKLLALRENSGAGIARNTSIKEAKGKYIAFCDSDDRWSPEKLDKQLAFMENHGYVLTHTSYMTCDENDNVLGIVVCRKKESFSSMCRDDKMGFLSVVYDVSKLGKYFMPNMRKRQDWALKLTILKDCKVSYGMKEPLAYYRLRDGSISNNKRSLVKYNISVYTDVLGWNKIRAYMFFYAVFIPHYFTKKIFNKLINL